MGRNGNAGGQAFGRHPIDLLFSVPNSVGSSQSPNQPFVGSENWMLA